MNMFLAAAPWRASLLRGTAIREASRALIAHLASSSGRARCSEYSGGTLQPVGLLRDYEYTFSSKVAEILQCHCVLLENQPERYDVAMRAYQSEDFPYDRIGEESLRLGFAIEPYFYHHER